MRIFLQYFEPWNDPCLASNNNNRWNGPYFIKIKGYQQQKGQKKKNGTNKPGQKT